MNDNLGNPAPDGQIEDVRRLFEGSDRPRGPSPLSKGPQFPVGLEGPTKLFREDLGDTVPVLVVSIRHQRRMARLIFAPSQPGVCIPWAFRQMPGRKNEMEMERSITTEDDSVSSIVIEFAEFCIHLGESRLAKIVILSSGPCQILFELLTARAVKFDGDDKKSTV